MIWFAGIRLRLRALAPAGEGIAGWEDLGVLWVEEGCPDAVELAVHDVGDDFLRRQGEDVLLDRARVKLVAVA